MSNFLRRNSPRAYTLKAPRGRAIYSALVGRLITDYRLGDAHNGADCRHEARLAPPFAPQSVWQPKHKTCWCRWRYSIFSLLKDNCYENIL